MYLFFLFLGSKVSLRRENLKLFWHLRIYARRDSAARAISKRPINLVVK